MKKTIHPLIGFHTAVAGGNPRGIGEDYVHKLHNNNIPVAITCADGWVGIGDALAKPHPDDVLIYRVVRDGSEKYAVPDYKDTEKSAARRYWTLVKPFIADEVHKNKDKVWVAFGNELNKDAAEWVLGWSLETAKIMNDEGYKAVGPNWSTGTPEPEAWSSPSGLAFLRYCSENPDMAAVGIHEYSLVTNDLFRGEGSLVGRYKSILKACQDNAIPRPTILIKEFGYAATDVPGPSQIVADLKELYKRYPDYPPATLWFLGPQFDNVANKLQPSIDDVGDFVLNTTFEVDLEEPVIIKKKEEELFEEIEEIVVEPIHKSERGIELDFFKMQDRSEFKANGRLWFEFRYNNLFGENIRYGGMGIAVHRWTGDEWVFHYYQHSFKGKLRPVGGPPSDGGSHEDNWKVDQEGIFALTPFLTFDAEATNKRDRPGDISDGFHMDNPIYVKIGPGGGRIDDPPASLFAKKVIKKKIIKKPVKPKDQEKPVTKLGAFLWEESQKERLISLNPDAALQKIIFRDGFMPVSEEFREEFEGVKYAVQFAEHLGTGEKRVYYAIVGKWGDVCYVTSAPAEEEKPEEKEEVEEKEEEVEEVEEKEEKEELKEVLPAKFHFEIWPTTHKRVNQYFGKNPEVYKKFGLPGHEGIDLQAPMGSPYYCVAPGIVTRVTDKRWNGEPSAYGWHVVVDHGDGYSTLYGHAMPNPPVQKGQRVEAGQILAYSGNTGNSTGPHLHLTLKKKGYVHPGWDKNPKYADPWPLLKPLFYDIKPPMGELIEGWIWSRYVDERGDKLAITTGNLNMRDKPDSETGKKLALVPNGATVRLLRDEKQNDYFFVEVSRNEVKLSKDGEQEIPPRGDRIDLLSYIRGDGRQYEVRNEWGSQERFQTETDGTDFYQKKNHQWEQFFFDEDFIYRDIDTSPGAGRFYQLKDADLKRGSRWIRRHMQVGETYTQSRFVQFYNKNDGSKSAANSGHATTVMKLVKRHPTYKFQTDMVIKDVIELAWLNAAGGVEKYFFAKGYGLVGWARTHHDPNTPGWSAISEEHAPGSREPLARESIRRP